MTEGILTLYKRCNKDFEYKPMYTRTHAVLTTPAVPKHNGGVDNEGYDLIVREGDELSPTSTESNTNTSINTSTSINSTAINGWREGARYTVIGLLGRGTFGQVFKCRDEERGLTVAVKVLKNKAAYFRQGLLEVGILTAVNTNCDRSGARHTLRILDHFVHKNHLCVVTELLGRNLYEQIKGGTFRGVTVKAARSYLRQLLDALQALRREGIVHCDLKPENVLLSGVSSTTTAVSLIDFGSACYERASPLYTYVQSRHYRAPEVILGLRYTAAVDMWSLGCIAAEMILGIPLLPGADEYNQLYKITSMLGVPPAEMIEKGTKGSRFYKADTGLPGRFMLRPPAEYGRMTGTRPAPDRRYVPYSSLEEFAAKVPMKTGYAPGDTSPAAEQKEIRRAYVSFLRGLLEIDPRKRWTPEQARMHPFLTEAPMASLGPQGFVPPSPQMGMEVVRERMLVPAVPPGAAFETKEATALKGMPCTELYDMFVRKMKCEKTLIDVNTGKVLTFLADPIIPAPLSAVPVDSGEDDEDDVIRSPAITAAVGVADVDSIIEEDEEAAKEETEADKKMFPKVAVRIRRSASIAIAIATAARQLESIFKTTMSQESKKLLAKPNDTNFYVIKEPLSISDILWKKRRQLQQSQQHSSPSPLMSPIQVAQPSSVKPQLTPSDNHLKYQLSPQLRSTHLSQHTAHLFPPPPIQLQKSKGPELPLGVSPGGFGGKSSVLGYLQSRKATAAAAVAAAALGGKMQLQQQQQQQQSQQNRTVGSGQQQQRHVGSIPISFTNTRNVSIHTEMGQSWSNLNKNAIPKMETCGTSPTTVLTITVGNSGNSGSVSSSSSSSSIGGNNSSNYISLGTSVSNYMSTAAKKHMEGRKFIASQGYGSCSNLPSAEGTHSQLTDSFSDEDEDEEEDEDEDEDDDDEIVDDI